MPSDERDQEIVQLTLAGEETDEPRERPETFLWCPKTQKWVLRSCRFDWPYELVENPGDEDDGNLGAGIRDSIDDKPERVGGMYEIELSYSVDFCFRIPARSEHEAKERAEDLVDYPHNCSDMFQVHSRDREIKAIFEDDEKLPDDFDPYDGTPLWEVLGDV